MTPRRSPWSKLAKSPTDDGNDWSREQRRMQWSVRVVVGWAMFIAVVVAVAFGLLPH